MSLLGELRSSERRWEIGMINGPNMPNLGRRDPRVYGTVKDIGELVTRVERLCEALGVTLRGNICSNSEAEILGWIHEHGPDLDGIIINPAGLTTFGEATRHALEETGRPFVEVHFGNIARRGVESRFSSTAAGVCFGLKRHSYTAGVVALVGALDGDDISSKAAVARLPGRGAKEGSQDMGAANGLLLALSTAPEGREQEYQAWYDEEHAPARLTVPGIRTARRYRDTTADRDYLACYDLDSADVLDQPEYLKLPAEASDRERRILREIAPDRRVYQGIPTPEVSGARDWGICGDALLAVWWTPAPGTDEDFNAWYSEEHVPLLMKVPGWLRIRRYSVLTGDGPRYLALHDLTSEDALREPAHAAAGQTPWRERMAASRREYSRRLFRLWRRFD